jgi:hypothetical protein
LLPDFDSTLRTESVPKLLLAELCRTHESRSAPTVALEHAGVTLQVRDAGVWSTFPEESIARTRTSCEPTVKPVYWCGDAQPVHVPPSREHWKLEPASLEENVNVALVLEVEPDGPVSIVVSGAVVSGSIVHE